MLRNVVLSERSRRRKLLETATLLMRHCKLLSAHKLRVIGIDSISYRLFFCKITFCIKLYAFLSISTSRNVQCNFIQLKNTYIEELLNPSQTFWNSYENSISIFEYSHVKWYLHPINFRIFNWKKCILNIHPSTKPRWECVTGSIHVSSQLLESLPQFLKDPYLVAHSPSISRTTSVLSLFASNLPFFAISPDCPKVPDCTRLLRFTFS